MVKLLSDLCLGVIQGHLDKVRKVKDLPTYYKEVLIERLGWHDMLTPEYIHHVAYNLFAKTLRRINFYKCDQINDNVLAVLERTKCNLEYISITECINVSDAGIHSITTDQKELSVLKVKKMRHLTDDALQCVQSPCLKIVNLKNCWGITFKGVSALAEQNRNIKELYLWGIAEYRDLGVNANHRKTEEHADTIHEYIVNTAYQLGSNLEVLDTKLNQLCDDCLIAVAQNCPNLKRLNLHGSSRITGEALTKFSMGCTNLKGLDLSFCTMLCKAPDIEALWTLPQTLTDLSLTGILLTDEAIFVECLQRLRNLKSVKLCGIPVLNEKSLTEILKSIGEHLTYLDLSGSSINEPTDAGLAAISEHCHSLECLYLSLLQNVTGAGLVPLLQDPGRAAKLRKLSLSIRELDEQVLLEVVHNCHYLEHLDLSGVAIVTDDILINLAHNSRALKELSLKGCRQVTDAAVCELVRCCALESLVLSGVNNLTDACIFALANSCHYLEEIYLNGCANISPTAVRYLVDCTIPRLFVVHAIPNASRDQLMAKNLDTGQFCRADLLDNAIY